MACRMKDFNITSESQTLIINGHSVEIASATTKHFAIEGVVYFVDGRMKGFTGNKDAVIYWVEKDYPTV